MPKGKPNKRYTPEFKIMVVETMHKEGLSQGEARRRFDISDHNAVAKWERIYLEEDLIAEVQRLRAENAYLKKLNALVSERVRQEKKHK
jgi:transposase-like protein